MKRMIALVLVCTLMCVSVTGHQPAVIAATVHDVLYLEVPQDSYCRAPATTVYLPIMLGNLSADPSMLIQSIEVLDAKGQVMATERVAFKLESLAGKAGSSDEIRTALGIIPPTPADIATARNLIAQATSTADSKQKSILIEQAFFASRAKQSMKNPEELTAEEAKIQQLLKPVTLAVDLAQFTTDTTSETAVPVTVRITGDLAGQPFTVDQQTMVFLLASLPNGGMWHPGDGHVHTSGRITNVITQPDTLSSYPLSAKENYGFSDATDEASILDRRNQAQSTGMQWIVVTDHAGNHTSFWTDEARLELEEWQNNIYQTACSRATTLYSPTVTVCPGEELATKEMLDPLQMTGHLLSYSNSSYAASYGTCGTLTTNVANAGGFGIIAHPYGGIPWSNWAANPWRGLEVISNQVGYSTDAVNTWDTFLRNDIVNEIGESVRHVAMANSDVHSPSYVGWGKNMNYIYTGSYSAPGTSPSAVWNPIRQGTLTASSDGSFAAATVNGVYPGNTATIPAGSTVSVFVTGTPVSGLYTEAEVRVFRNGYLQLTPEVVPLSGINFTRYYSFAVPVDTYIRVEVWYRMGGSYAGYCFVNPVFIDTY